MLRKLRTFTTNTTKVWENIRFSITMLWGINKTLMVQSVLIYVVQGVAPVVLAYLTGQLIDAVVGTVNGNTGLRIPVIFLAIVAVVQLLYSQSMNAQQYISIKLRKSFAGQLSEDVMLRFHELDHSHYETTDFNRLMNKIHTNINIISLTPERTFRLLASLVQLFTTIGTIIFLSPGIVGLLVISVLPIVVVLIYTARMRWRTWDEIDQDLRLRNRLENTASSIDQINELKIFNITDYFRRQWRKYYDMTENKRIDVERIGQRRLFGANIFEGVVQFGVAVWLLLRVVRDATFSLGDFEFYRRLINDFSNASGRLASGFQALNESNLFLRDYQELLRLVPTVQISTDRHTLEEDHIPSIEFRNVSFKYPESDEYVLKNINLYIAPGEDIAMVGRNGAGKTTIIKLLMRFYDVTEGSILIDGVDITRLDLESWYKHVGVLLQHFNRYSYFKARKSIGIGDTSRIDETDAVKGAAQTAGAHEYIDKLPQGYETILDKSFDYGTDLSGGEWQRVALARGFFRDANILILDEPTAAVDAKAEQEIFETIRDTQQGKTTIIISHRFSTVRRADTIYVIDGGEIRESGSHDQLMAQQGIYHELFEAQAKEYR